MPDYSRGKVYMLTCDGSESVYVGSTTATLNNRLSNHKANYKRYLANKHHYVSSFELFKIGDVCVELLEDYPCETRRELEAREGFYIDKLKSEDKDIVNERAAGLNISVRISEDKKTYYREYRRIWRARKKAEGEKK